MPAPTNLADWLAYQQTLHPRGIDLGLARVSEVAKELQLGRPGRLVITVGGTNGKGSTVAMLVEILSQAGYRVGSYTSPHLLRYNERLSMAGENASDADWIASFSAVESARADIGLTYFEFGTLAALWQMQRANLDVAVLEVGLGGRLDAVNIIDADVSVVTTVALDHQDYLGHDLDGIGAEKAGIARRDRPLVIGDPQPPAGLLASAAKIGARLLRAGVSFRAEPGEAGRWSYVDETGSRLDLPQPALAGAVQRLNAAAAIAALRALAPRLMVPEQAIAAGLKAVHLPGRLQQLGGDPQLILDVAHNPQAARQLATWLIENPRAGRSVAVFGALADKDIEAICTALADCFEAWHLVGLDVTRGLNVQALQRRAATRIDASRLRASASMTDALAAASLEAGRGGRVLIFGSFHTVGEALHELQPTPG